MPRLRYEDGYDDDEPEEKGHEPDQEGEEDEPDLAAELPLESDWTPEDAPEACPNCGAEVYAYAEQCPSCGEYIIDARSTAATRGASGEASEWRGKPWWWIALGAAGVAAVIWLMTRY